MVAVAMAPGVIRETKKYRPITAFGDRSPVGNPRPALPTFWPRYPIPIPSRTEPGLCHASSLLPSQSHHASLMLLHRFRIRLTHFLSHIRSSMSQKLSPTPSFLDTVPHSEHIPIHNWAGTATSPENLALSRSSTITYVKYFKSIHHVNHEALELEVNVGGNPNHKAWLFVERAGAARPSWSPASSLTSLATSIDIVAQLGNISSSLPAEDRILVTATSRVSDKSYNTITTLELPENTGFCVTHAVALLVTVSSSDHIYKLFKANCYWFAQGVYSAIEDRYGGTTIQGKSTMKAGHFGPLEVTSGDLKVRAKALEETREAWQRQIEAYTKLKTREEVSIVLLFFIGSNHR